MVTTFRPRPVRRGERLSHAYVNRLAESSLQRITVLGGRAQHIGNSVAVQVDPDPTIVQENKWLGEITAFTPAKDAAGTAYEARWDYTVEAVRIRAFLVSGTSGQYDLATEILTGDDAKSVTAKNRLEFDHIFEPAGGTPWVVWGVDVHGDDYPAGFLPMPVGGGGTDNTTLQTNTLVEVTESQVPNPQMNESEEQPATITIYTFAAMGSHDGTCAAPA